MHKLFKSSFSRVALVAGLAVAAWSPNSFACSSQPYISSVCLMAATNLGKGFSQTYLLADGRSLSTSQYQALYALIGLAYGGDGKTTFKLPDLRARMVVGAGASSSVGTEYQTGQTGGAISTTLTVEQLPIHHFAINNIPVNVSQLTATTAGSPKASVDLHGLTANGQMPPLQLYASTSAPNSSNPTNNILSAANIYSSGTSSAALNINSIPGGIMSVTFNASPSTAPITFTTPITSSISGQATASGQTTDIGNGVAVPTLSPFIAMNYYIAVSGTYPSRD